MRAFKSVDEANGAKKKSTKGRKKRAARSN
jgi:hypothetical protein